MNKTAKRIVSRIYRYLAQIDVIIPAHSKDELEKIVAEELKQHEKRGAFLGREEMEADETKT
jgi:hypothetical protein